MYHVSHLSIKTLQAVPRARARVCVCVCGAHARICVPAGKGADCVHA